MGEMVRRGYGAARGAKQKPGIPGVKGVSPSMMPVDSSVKQGKKEK